MKSFTNERTEGPFGPISVEPNLVLVCDSKTGSSTLTETAETIDLRISEASKGLL